MLRIVTAAALLLTSAQASAQFGIRMGQPISTLKIVKTDGGGRYTVTAPDPVAGFDFYQVVATPQTGVCKIVAYGANLESDSFGDLARSRFRKLVAALDAKYGNGKEFDFLRSGSIWKEPREWTMAVKQKERTLAKFWDREEGSALPSDVASISVEVKALDSDTSYVNAYYEFQNFSRCKDALDALDASGL